MRLKQLIVVDGLTQLFGLQMVTKNLFGKPNLFQERQKYNRLKSLYKESGKKSSISNNNKQLGKEHKFLLEANIAELSV